ncbi:hypothetical protein [Cognatilysobacter lacus]|uniref:Uncharacterized protein n=1 Tax=Cognatilysobacter lacus TaxID=1643323 RepID=A0A5D8YYH5_9GAMM|nr:hypothetical protein [Lysobacter lacus]TZF87775.1 hypothetical protein FW784_10650 [Lysobacter lacus]
MTKLAPGEKIVALGVYRYAGEVECELRIVFSPVRYGTGDYEDDPAVAEDRVEDAFYVQYGSTTERGVFNSGTGPYPTIEQARAAADAARGIGATVRWLPAGA